MATRKEFERVLEIVERQGIANVNDIAQSYFREDTVGKAEIYREPRPPTAELPGSVISQGTATWTTLLWGSLRISSATVRTAMRTSR